MLTWLTLRHAQLLLAVVGGADPVVDALVQSFATNQMSCKPWPLTVPFKPVTKCRAPHPSAPRRKNISCCSL